MSGFRSIELARPENLPPVLVFGEHDESTIVQLRRCLEAVPGSVGTLCADGHKGYSMPIGGVVGYEHHVSPSGVGYDIGCGVMAVKTELHIDDFNETERERIADEIFARVSFGIGRKNDEPVDDDVFDKIAKAEVPEQRTLLDLARKQLGTVGSGNHYVDVLRDEGGCVWVATHFGSRGFGHKTATMFMNIANGLSPFEKTHDGEMDSDPLLLDIRSDAGLDYYEAMKLAGEYAYAGRRHVVGRVLDILGTKAVDFVHNHHNFTWEEYHFGRPFFVVRKGATPAFPMQRGFVGGSMDDICAVVRGTASKLSAQALYSTVHGAGRLMSRNQAIKGKHAWFCSYQECDTRFIPPQQKPPKDLKCPSHGVPLVKEVIAPPIDFNAVKEQLKEHRIILRGAGADEAPLCYRPLQEVLQAHSETIDVETFLRPFIVCMAPKDTKDPYKD